MTPETRLADIITALESAGVNCLVMGGHAVRFYGLNRDTADFDLHLAPDIWDELPQRLTRTSLFAGRPVVEGPTWRPRSFRRFQIGTLPTGREEWLEFWCGNHLLAPFAELFSRRENGMYGGRILSFLSLPDLIRSKETERTFDWQDVAILEEFLDARLLAQVSTQSRTIADAIGKIRSRKGFETALQNGFLADHRQVECALAIATISMTQAYLLPFAPQAAKLPATTPPMEPVIINRLRKTVPASPLHLTLVEAVRRRHRLAAQATDRADKESLRRSQGTP